MAVRRGAGNLVDVLKFITGHRGFDRLLKSVEVVSSSEGKCVCELTVDESHLNVGGTLHGGLTATLVDTISTLAIISADSNPGPISCLELLAEAQVSLDRLLAILAGDKLEIKSECVKKGNKLVFATVDMSRKSDGKLIAIGRHTKYV